MAKIGIVVAALVAWSAVSIGLAHLGEPQSVWLWCTMLGVTC